MDEKKNEIILFENQGVKLKVNLREENVWITANQMAILFGKDETTIRKHINNVFKDGELEKNNNTQKMRVDGVKQQVPFYNLDVIISVGYRVKSKNGVIFRQWANKILKDYMLKGYAVNQRRLEYLEKTVKLPEVIEIEDTLEAKQKLVDGLIEVVPYIDDMLLICNEEGKILKMYPNLDLTYDYIAGNCFVIGDDFENAGFRSLTEEEIKKARIDLTKRMFKYNKEKAHINKTNKNNHER